MNSQSTCCDHLFSGFTFQDIRNATPPEERGVYVIRVKRRGKPVTEIVQEVEKVVQHLNWGIVKEKVHSRIERLEMIDSCPVIYIGSAGGKGGKRTLKDRYSDFAGRHTAMFPLWALLYFGWDLEYGWMVEEENPGDLEESLKERYKQIHGNPRPALVER